MAKYKKFIACTGVKTIPEMGNNGQFRQVEWPEFHEVEVIAKSKFDAHYVLALCGVEYRDLWTISEIENNN